MIPITRPWLPPLEEYVKLLREVWNSRMLSNFAQFSARLEKVASDYIGSPHVLAVASGDVGLMIALKALGLPPGAPCFVSDFTFNSTINSALWNGLRPALVDVDPRTFNMSAESLLEAMARHPQPGVVLATHVFGNPCDSESLKAAAREHGSFLAFDAAHAYGSLRGGKPVGTLGDVEVFSLSGTKPVTSAEGGLISTPHDWLAERVIYLRAYGFQHDYRSRFVGVNGKISELHCALGVLTLPRVETAVQRRHKIAQKYRERLGDAVGWQSVRPGDRSTYKDVAACLGGRRQEVEEALAAGDVQTKRYFLPLHFMEPYRRYADGPIPVTEHLYESTLCLPVYEEITESILDMICDVIEGAFKAAEAKV